MIPFLLNVCWLAALVVIIWSVGQIWETRRMRRAALEQLRIGRERMGA
jgi:hypothetical protein